MNRQRIIRWLIPLCGLALVLGTSATLYGGGMGQGPEPPVAPEAPTPPAPPQAPPAPQAVAVPAAPMPPQAVIIGRGAWLGVRISEVTAEKAQELSLPEPTGALVDEVVEHSPAAQAGLQANDVIVGFAGERVRSAAQLRRLVRETPAGRTVQVEVSRAGQRRSFDVQLKERAVRFSGRVHVPSIPLPRIEIPEMDIRIFERRARLGISGDELTPQLAEYFGVEQGRGVLVREVLAGSPAAKAGLKAGDVIVGVDGEPVGSVGELRRALRGERAENRVTLTIVRDRRQQTLTVELEEPRRHSPRRTAEVRVGDFEWDFDFDYDVEALEALAERVREAEEHIRDYFESEAFRENLRRMEERTREVEQRLRERLESEEFQRQLRELERRARELERVFETI